MAGNNFFSELKRRNVYRVAIAYAATAWLLAQIASIVVPTFNAADWIMKLILIGLAIGFPVSLFIAWVYEISAEGLKKTEAIPKNESITVKTGKKLNIVIIGILLLAVVLLLTDKMTENVRGVAGISPLLPSASLPGAFKNQRVAVIPFDNQTNSDDLESFGLWASDHITSQLSILDNVKIVRSTNVQNNIQLASLGNKTSDGFTNATGAEIVIQGRYYLQENNLILHANVVEALTGEVIHVFKAIRGERDNRQGLLEKLGEQILRYWAVKDMTKFNKRPPDYEAFQLYSRASEIFLSKQEEAKILLINAVQQDTTFYIAMLKLQIRNDPKDSTELELREWMWKHLKKNYHLLTAWEKARFDHFEGIRNEDRLGIAEANLRMYELDPFDYISNTNAARHQITSANNPRKGLEILSHFPHPYQDPNRTYNSRIGFWMMGYYHLQEYENVLSVLDSVTIRDFIWNSTDVHLASLVRLGRQDELKRAVEFYENHLNELKLHNSFIGLIYDSICDEASILGLDSLVYEYANRLLTWCQENHDFDRTEFFTGLAYHYLRDHQKAFLHLKSSHDSEDINDYAHINRMGMIGICHAMLGQVTLAEEWVEHIKAIDTGKFLWNKDYNIATIYANLGEKEKAIEHVRKYIENNADPFDIHLNYDSRMMPLFGYPPFEELVKIVE